jgi:cobalamin biosynthesis protein CobD/CbiB
MGAGRTGTCFSLETDEAAGQRALLGMDTYIRQTKSMVRGVIYLEKAVTRPQPSWNRRVRTKLRRWMVGGWRLLVCFAVSHLSVCLARHVGLTIGDRSGETDSDTR